MKHILWLTPGFAADEADSSCIPPLQLLAEALQSSGRFHLHIVTLHFPYKIAPYAWKGLTVYPCAASARQPKLFTWFRALAHARKLIKQYPIEAIHSFWLNDAALVGQWLSRAYRLPHTVTLMGQDARPSNAYLRLFSLKKMHLTALSPFHDDQLQASTGRRANEIIPWGIEKIAEAPTAVSFDILGVGSLISLKNYALFIRLVAKIAAEYPEISATLIGDGPEKQALEKLAEALEIGDKVKFTGNLPREEVLAVMRQSAIFLHTSTYESFGFVLLEAAASGMQVVSTPVGIAATHSEWGIAETEEDLLVKLREAMTRPSVRQPRFPYLMEQTAKRYEALYESAPDFRYL